MKTRVKLAILSATISLLLGCASTSTMQVEGHHVIILSTVGVVTPSTTTILTEDSGRLQVLNAAGGPGLIGQFATPAAIIGAGVLIGKGMEGISTDPKINVTSEVKGVVKP